MEKKALKDLQRFIDGEVVPAIADLGKLGDKHRIHVQKLVYTNLVDRFDTMVDTAMLDNCREEQLVEEAASRLTGPITESDLIRLLMHADTLQDALNEKLKAALRMSILRERHSRKAQALFKLMRRDVDCWNKPRVNPATGDILEQIKPPNKQQPLSICGYADWLYSRRNSIVHGGGTNKFLENDRAQLKKLFNCVPAATIKIKLASVETAACFYKAATGLLLDEVS